SGSGWKSRCCGCCGGVSGGGGCGWLEAEMMVPAGKAAGCVSGGGGDEGVGGVGWCDSGVRERVVLQRRWWLSFPAAAVSGDRKKFSGGGAWRRWVVDLVDRDTRNHFGVRQKISPKKLFGGGRPATGGRRWWPAGGWLVGRERN
nr:hypothetical protein [Tanacetum cinerariifolium]